jgi:3-hydroxybutyryl-CoA dehydrogenase
MKHVAVIGAGTMGNGIAHVIAMSGINVKLIDISQEALDRAISTIEKNLGRMLSKGAISEIESKDTLSRISTYTDMAAGVKDADLVIEAATEREDLKLKIFKQLDELAPKNAMLATNTSSISITKIASATTRTDKVIGMHFFNPVPVMRLVEIINAYDTSADTTKAIVELTNRLTKVPVEVQDYPGFVSNRILMPMLNEAIYALHEGIANVQEIDQVMKLGMAHPMGPLQLADFVGLDVCLNICNVLYEGFGNPKYAPCPLLVNMVAAGKLGRKSGEGFYDYSAGGKDLVVAKRFSKA